MLRKPGKAPLLPYARRTVLAASLIAGTSLVAGTMAGPSLAASSEVDPMEIANLAPSPLGHYLASRFAVGQQSLDDAAQLILLALANDPEEPQLLRQSLGLLASEGRFDEAADVAKRLVSLGQDDDGDALIALVMGVNAAAADHWTEAHIHLDAITEDGLGRILGPLLGSWVSFGIGDPEGAQKQLSRLDSVGVGPLQHMHSGLVYDLAGDAAAAEAAYQQSIDGATQLSLRLVTVIGNFFERNGQPERARELYATYMTNNAGDYFLEEAMARLDNGTVPEPVVRDAKEGLAEALFNLAGLLNQGESRLTAMIYDRAALHLRPRFELAEILIGEILQAQGRSEDAIAAYQSISEDSIYIWSVRQRIADEFANLDRVDEALVELEAMAAEHPDRIGPLLRIGNMLRRAERYPEAAAAYDRLIDALPAIEPAHWTVFYFRGISYERSGEWDKAEADFLKALELEPEQPQVMNYLAYSWVEQQSHLDEARTMLERAVELRPSDGYIVDSLGWALYRLGHVQESVGYLERAVELSPNDPVINDHLGDAYWRVGRQAEARFQWNRALSFEPEDDVVAQIRLKLDVGLVVEDDTAIDAGDDAGKDI